MQRRRQSGSTNDRRASTGFEERESVVPSNLVSDSGTRVKIEQIGTATKQDMLAIVDYFACARMLIGRGATAEKRPALEERDSKTGIGKCAACSESGQASTDDRDGSGFLWRKIR